MDPPPRFVLKEAEINMLIEKEKKKPNSPFFSVPIVHIDESEATKKF